MEQRIRPNRDTCGQAIGQVSKWKRRILAQVAILEKCTYPATVGHTLSDLCMAIRRRARSLCARIWHTHNDYSIFTYCTPRIRGLNPNSRRRRRRRHIICAIKLIAAALLLGQTPLWPLSSSSDSTARLLLCPKSMSQVRVRVRVHVCCASVCFCGSQLHASLKHHQINFIERPCTVVKRSWQSVQLIAVLASERKLTKINLSYS